MTFAEYLQKVAEEKELHPEWRMGQTYYNVLLNIRPELANEVRGSNLLDPFYREELIAGFLNFVCYNWGG